MAKTNASPMKYGKYGDPFYGLAYVGGKLYLSGELIPDKKNRICNPSNLNDSACHDNDNYLGNITNSSKNRTLPGHAANGVFYMVCVDSGMTLPVAAKMMCDLGCDYAVNMDGGTASIMRVASSYRNGISPNTSGNMNSRGSDYYGIITCAYKL